jgi:ribulose-5-phosphate 4-epimerase/fuculose-1-phosphate aldolase
MTRDQIDDLMHEHGIVVVGEAVYALVQLVITIEREACALIAKNWDASHPHTNYGACISNAIRARGEG